MFQEKKKEAVEIWIIRSRFGDMADKKTLARRKIDFGSDCNMNLIRGKVIRSTDYFDQLIVESANEYRAHEVARLKAIDVSFRLLN